LVNFLRALLSGNQSLTDAFVEKYIHEIRRQEDNETAFCLFSGNRGLSLEFVNKYIEELDWYFVCTRNNLTIDFLEENIHRFVEETGNGDLYEDLHEDDDTIGYCCDWMMLLHNNNGPSAFIEKYLDKIIKAGSKYWNYWGSICGYEKFNTDFYEKHIENIVWEELCKNSNIPFEFFEKYVDKIDYSAICYNENIPTEFYEKNLDNLNWEAISQNENIPVEFYEKNLDKLNWEKICKNRNIPVEFYEKHLDKLYWNILCSNNNIPESLFEKYWEKVDWEILCSNNNISMNFFETNIDKVVWDELSKNNFNRYLRKKEYQKEKRLIISKMKKVFNHITTYIYCVPARQFAVLPKGGDGYRELIEKYKF